MTTLPNQQKIQTLDAKVIFQPIKSFDHGDSEFYFDLIFGPRLTRIRMGRITKKGERGQATKYITRNRALKKLQLKLSDFRRLCILKGIYPRDPKNKRKASPSATSSTTFYLLKDIQFLAHEPLLEKIRELKAFGRKMVKYIGKRSWAKVRSLEAHMKPTYSLDHLVRERYPTFMDALKDLDDALSMIALFATLPQTGRYGHHLDTAKNCARLLREFEAYVIETGALCKSFVSIKGIYFQAKILGEHITWVIPHEFSLAIPTDVDFRVMLTFLEFYQTLLGFVNFKLFSRLGWKYPVEEIQSEKSTPLVIKENFPVVSDANDIDKAAGMRPIFEGMIIFISREISCKPVGLIIQALGGRVAWHADDGSCPFEESDPAITHQVIDRPLLSKMMADRIYIQPQWIFDCLNAGQIVDPTIYRIGAVLPPHLSPFADHEEDEEEEEEGEEGEEGENVVNGINSEDGKCNETKHDQSVGPKDTPNQPLVNRGSSKAANKKIKKVKIIENEERKQLAVSIMSKKHQKLYKQMQHTRKRKADEKRMLKEKKSKVKA